MQRRNFLGAFLGAAGVTAVAKVTEAASSAAAPPAKVTKLAPAVTLVPKKDVRSLDFLAAPEGEALEEFLASPAVRVTSSQASCSADCLATWDVTYTEMWDGAPWTELDATLYDVRDSLKVVSAQAEVSYEGDMVDVTRLGLPTVDYQLPPKRRVSIRVKYIQTPPRRGECIQHSSKAVVKSREPFYGLRSGVRGSSVTDLAVYENGALVKRLP
jgi:hypothetical protein